MTVEFEIPTLRITCSCLQLQVIGYSALVLLFIRACEARIVYSRLGDYDSQVASAGHYRDSSQTHGHSHSHGHATSYHNQVLHSYHPVKVYLNKHGHPSHR